MYTCILCRTNVNDLDGHGVCPRCQEIAVSCPSCGAIYDERGDQIGEDGRCVGCRTDDGSNDDAEREAESARARELLAALDEAKALDASAAAASATTDTTLKAVKSAAAAKRAVEVQIETVRGEIEHLTSKIADALVDAPAYVRMRDAVQIVLNTYEYHFLDDARATLDDAQQVHQNACQAWLDAKSAADAAWVRVGELTVALR